MRKTTVKSYLGSTRAIKEVNESQANIAPVIIFDFRNFPNLTLDRAFMMRGIHSIIPIY